MTDSLKAVLLFMGLHLTVNQVSFKQNSDMKKDKTLVDPRKKYHNKNMKSFLKKALN